MSPFKIREAVLTRCGACSSLWTAAIWYDRGIVVLKVWYMWRGGYRTRNSAKGSRSSRYCTRHMNASEEAPNGAPSSRMLSFSLTLTNSIISHGTLRAPAFTCTNTVQGTFGGFKCIVSWNVPPKGFEGSRLYTMRRGSYQHSLRQFNMFLFVNSRVQLPYQVLADTHINDLNINSLVTPETYHVQIMFEH